MDDVEITDEMPITEDLVLYAHWRYTGGAHVKPEEAEKQPATPTEVNFTDVQPSDWYADAVSNVAEQGLMTGVAEGVFDPNGFVTRAMVWATETGLINGMNGSLKPQDGATRAQLAAMLLRFLDA